MTLITARQLSTISLFLGSLFFTATTSAQNSQSATAVPACQVFLYVAGECGHPVEGRRHTAAAELLVEQLRLSGVPENQVTRVDGQPLNSLTEMLLETAAAAGTDRTLLVILIGVGSTTGSQDLLLGPDGTEGDSAIPVQRVLDVMNESNSRRQLLIVDGSVDAGTSKRLPSTQDFGNSQLRLYPGQTVLLSRCSILRGETPLFIAAVADAMTELADLAGDTAINSGDGVITETEFLQYIVSFAAHYGIKPVPRISSDSSEDFPVINAARLDQASRLGPDSRQRMIDFLLQSAYLSLLLENKPGEARLALQRALSYRPQPGQREEMVGLWLTSLASDGAWETAWQLAQDRGQPLLIVAPKGLQLQRFRRVIATLNGNEILEVSKREAGTLTVRQVLRPAFTPAGISLDVDQGLANSLILESSLPTAGKTAEAAEQPLKNRDEAERLINILRAIEVR